MALVRRLVQASTSAAHEAVQDPAAVDVLIEWETSASLLLIGPRHDIDSKAWISSPKPKDSRGLSMMQFQLEAVLDHFRRKAHLSQALPSIPRDNRDNVEMCQDSSLQMLTTLTKSRCSDCASATELGLKLPNSWCCITSRIT